MTTGPPAESKTAATRAESLAHLSVRDNRVMAEELSAAPREIGSIDAAGQLNGLTKPD